MTSALITAAELKTMAGQENVRILDASYGQSPSDHGIPGAIDFDIDDVADPLAPLPHIIPSADIFEQKAGALGISNDDTIIVYDRAGIAMAAARAWWMFRLFGHKNVRVLDGGLPAWLAAGGSLSVKQNPCQQKQYHATFQPHLFKTKDDMLANIDKNDFIVFDARDKRRYAADVPEPRPGMHGGHIPGSLSMPFADLIDPETGLMKSRNDLEKIISAPQKPIACSCGSGVTACVVALALHELGRPDVAIYGGSWAEWGANPTLPKNKGYTP